jgi:hypothetical protein
MIGINKIPRGDTTSRESKYVLENPVVERWKGELVHK